MDAWRVLLPLLGVLYHGLGGETGWGRHPEFVPVMSAIDSFRMEAFFAMAGLLAGTRLSRPGYLPNRLRSTLVPVVTLWAMATIVTPAKFLHLLSESTLHMWFLICLAELSVVAVIAERLGALRYVDNQNGWLPFAIVALTFALFAQIMFPGMSPDDGFGVVQSPLKSLYYAPYFIFGLFVSRNERLATSLSTNPLLWLLGPIAFAALALAGVFAGNPPTLLGDGLPVEILRLVCAAGMTVLVVGSSAAVALKVGPKVIWFANASFTLYVLHLPFLKLSGKLFGRLDLAPRLSLALAFATIGPLAVYWLMTRSPILKTAFNGARLTTTSARPLVRWFWQGRPNEKVAYAAPFA